MGNRVTNANVAGFSRLLLVAPTAYSVAVDARGLAVILLGLAAISDIADGFFSRREGTVSMFGAYLDLAADKILVATILIVLLRLGEVPGWIPAVIIAREFLVMSMRSVAVAEGTSIPPSLLGGVKIIATYVAMIASAAGWRMASALWPVAAGLTILSGVHYLYGGRHLLAGSLFYQDDTNEPGHETTE